MRTLLVILFSLSFYGISQQFHFKQYSLAEGLSRSGVYDVLQDRNGFIWVATEGGGLCKFDGENFATYTRFNGLASEKVRNIFQDKNGVIWLGTTKGLSYYDGHDFHTLNVKDGIADNFVRSITQDHQGNIWIGSDKGITIIDAEEKGVSTKLKTNFSLPHKKVRTLISQDNIVWIGTDKGLGKYENDEIEILSTKNGLTSDIILCLFIDSKNNLWIGTQDGLNQFDKNGIMKAWTEKDGLISNRVRSITEDHLGNIWIGTSKGISLFKDENFLNLDKTNGLANDRIRCLTTDNFNNIWIGTYFGGIMRFNHQDFIAYTPQEGLISNQIYSISEDDNGNIMTGTYDGVSLLKIENEKLVSCANTTQFNGLADNAVKTIYKDENDYYWYGTANGISIMKNNKTIQITKKEGLKNANITEIKKYKGTYWIGTEDGLAQISTNDYKKFRIDFLNEDDGLAGKEVSSITHDKKGNVWVSFADGGLTLFKEKRLITPFLPEGVNEITALVLDSTDQFWIGTNGRGVYHGRYIAEKSTLDLSNISTSNSDLHSNYIFSLLLSEQNIWIGLENGLDIIMPLKDSTFRIQSYGPERGFFGLQNNQGASFEDSKGNLWFGTVNGLFCLRKHALGNLTEGKTSINYIKSLKVNGESIDWKNSNWCDNSSGTYELPSNLKLPYDQNNISFDFIALNFISPTDLKYSWKLDGFDDNWKIATDKSYTTYTNLYPGDYSFLLKSSNEHGLITGEPVEFKFSIEKPWWSTWLFRIISILLILTLIILIISLRTRQLRRKQRYLEKTIQERTTEITLQKEELEFKNIEITDSILYSRRIQNSILPSKESLNNLLNEHFIFYKPKDIVSGDFYWIEASPSNPNQIFVAVADCTGHGVPGAMVSLIGTRALNSSVRESQLIKVSEILNKTNHIVQEAFTDSESGDIIKDGMDIALCSITYKDEDNVELQFAGAHNPVWIVRKSDQKNILANDNTIEPNISDNGYNLFEIKGNKQPIGYFENQTPFKNFSVPLKKGDRIYMTSDGYADQFGGERGKKFKYKALKLLLLSIQANDLDTQNKLVQQCFFDWKGDLEQLDDVCMMGLEV